MNRRVSAAHLALCIPLLVCYLLLLGVSSYGKPQVRYCERVPLKTSISLLSTPPHLNAANPRLPELPQEKVVSISILLFSNFERAISLYQFRIATTLRHAVTSWFPKGLSQLVGVVLRL